MRSSPAYCASLIAWALTGLSCTTESGALLVPKDGQSGGGSASSSSGGGVCRHSNFQRFIARSVSARSSRIWLTSVELG